MTPDRDARPFTVTKRLGTDTRRAALTFDEVTAEVGRACREIFRTQEGYRTFDRGADAVVGGRRFEIRGPKFGAVVHVQLASQRGRYRADPRGALQLRIGGHAKVVPRPRLPLFPREAGWNLLLGLGLSFGLVWFGVWGTGQVVAHPSHAPSVDGFGLLVTMSMVAAAAVIFWRMLGWARELPWASLGLDTVAWGPAPTDRWRELAVRVHSMTR